MLHTMLTLEPSSRESCDSNMPSNPAEKWSKASAPSVECFYNRYIGAGVHVEIASYIRSLAV
jgi:hypothetical protein